MKEKIYCANCAHCILFRQLDMESDSYTMRVRCAKKKWLKSTGEEKIYKYFTVGSRVMEECSEYSKMGNLQPYAKNLKKELPIKDMEYAVK